MEEGELDQERPARRTEEEEDEGDVFEEGARAKVKIVSDKPSKREIEEHMATHIPFRSWCPHCVRGKSKSTPRAKRKEGEEEEVPVISVDYMYMEAEDPGKGVGMPILVSRDRKSKWINAAVVPQKGNCAYAIKRLSEDIGALGYSRVVLKSDQEPAIKELKARVKMERAEDIIMEEAPAYEHRANGEVERAIQTVQGQVRTLKSALEARYRTTMGQDWSVLPWMVRHAGNSISRYLKGADGLTAYRRLKGREFKKEAAEFGEGVWYMRSEMVGKAKLEPRWEDGIWLGIHDVSGEHIIGTRDGCLKAKDMKRKPEEDRWVLEALESMKGTPWEPTPGHPDRELKSRVIVREEPVLPPPEPTEEQSMRRLYIRKKDVLKYGATVGCEGCRAVVRGGVSRNHTEECRTRIEKAIREEGEGNRAQQAEDRVNKRLYKEMEKEMERANKAKEEEATKKAKEEEATKEEATKKRKEADEEEEDEAKRQRIQEEEESKKRQDTEDHKQGKLGAKQMRTDGRQPSSYKRKAEEDPEDGRDRARGSGEAAVPMEDDGEEATHANATAASSSGMGVDIDYTWRTKQSTIWDMRHGQRWDFSRVENRNKAKRRMSQLNPLLILGSRVDAVLQNFTRAELEEMEQDTKERIKARIAEHNEFLAELYQKQEDNGRFYMHEAIEGLASTTRTDLDGIERASYNYKTGVDEWNTEEASGKVTIWTNGEGLNEAVKRWTAKEERGDDVRWRQEVKLGLLQDLRGNGRIGSNNTREITAGRDKADYMGNLNALEQQEFYDNLSGEWLDPGMVREARKTEMEEVEKHGVYEKVPLEECYKETGKPPIGTRWVDTNKGDKIHPEYRSRLVAQEINMDKREDLFAATPPLEAKKLLFSMAVTEGIGYKKGHKATGMKLDFIDVRRAYFHAEARRKVYVRLPPEDYMEGYCGKLKKAMYGTRDAAQNWEYAYVAFMEKVGFARGAASPCVFYMKGRNLRVVVHGDDFTVLGYEEDLDWFRRAISEEYEVKFRGRIGPGATDDKAIRILNRVVEWTTEGIMYEADQRHAEIIVAKMGLEGGAKGVVTPGLKREVEPGDDEELNKQEATNYRGLVARGNYLTQDRSDIQYAVKELSRAMATPTVGDWKGLKRLARYLTDKLRVRVLYGYQEWKKKIDVYVDTDYAGCRKTRKSTSGGVATLGSHTIKSWSTTQAVIALSSGEAEFYGIVKGHPSVWG